MPKLRDPGSDAAQLGTFMLGFPQPRDGLREGGVALHACPLDRFGPRTDVFEGQACSSLARSFEIRYARLLDLDSFGQLSLRAIAMLAARSRLRVCHETIGQLRSVEILGLGDRSFARLAFASRVVESRLRTL